ncbi:hypothetical protein PsorP6_005577 [Peronosclerospora sorghi]|uniref:Uncharacterized protein n=1 Tax=Peronosclerospora sorghi TaxID=230839 RepID=A0ACC0W2E9_9STRA|nr:hypothetical protein PsorP6_005577 [Peronosclerospora sorghi]
MACACIDYHSPNYLFRSVEDHIWRPNAITLETLSAGDGGSFVRSQRRSQISRMVRCRLNILFEHVIRDLNDDINKRIREKRHWERRIVQLDLKPENVLLGADGHIRLTDFGLAKEMSDEDSSTSTMCGTNGWYLFISMFVCSRYAQSQYMAPEMIRRKAYNQAVDWWALGALIYEMVTGYPPFRHKNRKKLHHKILNEKLSLPQWLGPDTHSILKQLLERNVEKRLGSGKSSMFQVKGVQAIKKHAFFKGLDWGLLQQKKVQPPILPNIMSNVDTTYFSEEFTRQDVGRRSRIDSSSATGDTTKLFARFSWVAEDVPSFADIVRSGGVERDTTGTIPKKEGAKIALPNPSATWTIS